MNALKDKWRVIARFIRKLFVWRVQRWVVLSIVGLVASVAIYFKIDRWRSQAAWKQYKHGLEVGGRPLRWSAFIPPPVPDDQNFAMTPLLKPIFSGARLADGKRDMTYA